MSALNLVPKTLQYGYNNCAKSTLVTFILLISFISSCFVLIRLHSKLFQKEINGKKKFIKIMPSFALITFTFLLIWYFTNKGLGYEKRIWQSDYFVAFFINLVVLIVISPVHLATVKLGNGSKSPKTRRKWKQYLINGTFKLSFFFFWAFVLTPYYVFLVGHSEFFLTGKHAFASLLIFIAFCIISFFSFGRTPFAPLLPTIVLWGASSSYYSWTYTMSYAILMNFSGPSLTIAGFLFGFGFLNFLEPVLKGAKVIWAMFYVWLLGVIILLFWASLWWFYGYGQGGTGYEIFHTSSFYR